MIPIYENGEEGAELTKVVPVYAYIDADYDGYTENGTPITTLIRSDTDTEVKLSSDLDLLYLLLQSAIDSPNANEDDIEFDVYTTTSKEPFYSYFGNANNKPFYS
jgi:hypothetical protein